MMCYFKSVCWKKRNDEVFFFCHTHTHTHTCLDTCIYLVLLASGVDDSTIPVFQTYCEFSQREGGEKKKKTGTFGVHHVVSFYVEGTG